MDLQDFTLKISAIKLPCKVRAFVSKREHYVGIELCDVIVVFIEKKKKKMLQASLNTQQTVYPLDGRTTQLQVSINNDEYGNKQWA